MVHDFDDVLDRLDELLARAQATAKEQAAFVPQLADAQSQADAAKQPAGTRGRREDTVSADASSSATRHQ